MRIILIFLICLLTTASPTDITHQTDNQTDFSQVDKNNLTQNDQLKEDLRATPEDAHRLIQEAIDYLDEHGKEKAFKAFNDQDGQFCYKDTYIFAIDMDGLVLAHGGDLELVGTNQYYLKDSVGKYFIQEFIKLVTEKDEGWIEYKWRNYETFEIESKLTLLKRYDSRLFLGCGVYIGG